MFFFSIFLWAVNFYSPPTWIKRSNNHNAQFYIVFFDIKRFSNKLKITKLLEYPRSFWQTNADSEFSMLHEHNSLAVKPLVPEMEELTSFLKTILKKFNLWFYTLFQIICKLLYFYENFIKKGVPGQGKWSFYDQLNFVRFTDNLLKEIVTGIRSPEAQNIRMNREA